jgi:hypothetical protein
MVGLASLTSYRYCSTHPTITHPTLACEPNDENAEAAVDPEFDIRFKTIRRSIF